MNTFFEINTKGKIGYKKISNSELGRGTSHITHIGLFEDTLEFLTDYHKTAISKLIYDNNTKEPPKVFSQKFNINKTNPIK